jgi:hypothetical protein
MLFRTRFRVDYEDAPFAFITARIASETRRDPSRTYRSAQDKIFFTEL